MNKLISIIILLGALLYGCNDYLDVVPDNVATLDNAFANKNEAEKFLFTCYSILPREPDLSVNPAFLAGDELWTFWPITSLARLTSTPQLIARGNQNINNPMLNFWDGQYGGLALFQGIRNCNIFLENIDKPVDLDDYTKSRWIGEVEFMKAYFHFYLLRMYGPIPIMDKNIPITASPDEVKVKRAPVDSVVNYIVALMDSAATKLPPKIQNRTTELGRITKPIALAIKAKVLTTAASPLFNGNSDYANFKNVDGSLLFNPTYDKQKWERAAQACKEAIDFCESQGHKLYTFTSTQVSIPDSLRLEMSIRNAICEKWNDEIIWGSTNGNTADLQLQTIPRLDPANVDNEQTRGQVVPTMKMAELFYTKNGVPITEDKTWDYANRYLLKTAKDSDKYYLQTGYQTVGLHFAREPRFYADIAFDGSIWYMQNTTANKSWTIQAKNGQNQARKGAVAYSITGYFAKKLPSWKFVIQSSQNYTLEDYIWPIMRLGDLYLLYAEASNEAYGSNTEALSYLNKIRGRAGLKTVEESWTNFSTKPDKYTTQAGLREIIHQERLIELAFEGSRFWDLRRWKEAENYLNRPIKGWNITEASALNYYTPITLFSQEFVVPRDYLWPIKDDDIVINRNLVQNPGW